MIGQEQLQTEIQKQIKREVFPRFCILVGPRGAGKKLLAEQVSKWLNATLLPTSTSIADIRVMIENSHKLSGNCVHLIADADNMSVQARNALLKVTEEPPNNSYFIMTLEDENNTLDTIRSRATIFTMDRYTLKEIRQYIEEKLTDITKDRVSTIPIYTTLCETPGEVNLLNSMGALEFYEYCDKVVKNIAKVSTSNSFKIADKVALKDGQEGYDLKLFLKAFVTICLDEVIAINDPENPEMSLYAQMVLKTDEYLRELRNKSVNKQMLMDNWIMEIRDIWM